MSASDAPLQSYVAVADGHLSLSDYLNERPDYPEVIIYLDPTEVIMCSDIAEMLSDAAQLRILELFIDFGTNKPSACLESFEALFNKSFMEQLSITYHWATPVKGGVRTETKTLTLNRRGRIDQGRSSQDFKAAVMALSQGAIGSAKVSKRTPNLIGVPPGLTSTGRAPLIGGCFATLSNADLIRIFDADFISRKSRHRGSLSTAKDVIVQGRRLRHKMSEGNASTISKLLDENPEIYAVILNPEVRSVTSLDLPGASSSYRTCLYELRDHAGKIYRSDVIIFVE